MADEPETQSVQFTFPATGGTQSLNIGVYTLDFKNGVVIYPNRTTASISNSLSGRGIPYARCIAVQADNAVRIDIEGQGEAPVDADQVWAVGNIRFTRATLTVLTDSTAVHVWAHSHPNAYPRKLALLASGPIVNLDDDINTESTTNLAGGATVNGADRDVSDYGQFGVHVYAVANSGTLTVAGKISSSATYRTLETVAVADGTSEQRTYSKVLPFMRASYTNDAGAATTTFELLTVRKVLG